MAAIKYLGNSAILYYKYKCPRGQRNQPEELGAGSILCENFSTGMLFPVQMYTVKKAYQAVWWVLSVLDHSDLPVNFSSCWRQFSQFSWLWSVKMECIIYLRCCRPTFPKQNVLKFKAIWNGDYFQTSLGSTFQWLPRTLLSLPWSAWSTY